MSMGQRNFRDSDGYEGVDLSIAQRRWVFRLGRCEGRNYSRTFRPSGVVEVIKD